MNDRLYHITYLFNLPLIQEVGIMLGQGQVFGGGYTGHSSGRIFLTEQNGVNFWLDKYESLIAHKTDEPHLGWFPIVLEIDPSTLNLQDDQPGTKDARAQSYYVEKAIPTDSITGVWDGSEWIDLEEADSREMLFEALEIEDADELDDIDEDFDLDYEYFRPDDYE